MNYRVSFKLGREFLGIELLGKPVKNNGIKIGEIVEVKEQVNEIWVFAVIDDSLLPIALVHMPLRCTFEEIKKETTGGLEMMILPEHFNHGGHIMATDKPELTIEHGIISKVSQALNKDGDLEINMNVRFTTNRQGPSISADVAKMQLAQTPLIVKFWKKQMDLTDDPKPRPTATTADPKDKKPPKPKDKKGDKTKPKYGTKPPKKDDKK